MTFNEAENQIVELFPMAALITLRYEKGRQLAYKIDTVIECGAIICFPSGEGTPVSFYSPTWEGVLGKIKIHLLPKGSPSPEEEPPPA
jgi:hypothetical protein